MKKKAVELKFKDLESAKVYVQSLIGKKLSPTGNWSLHRIFTHCGHTFDYTISGFSKMMPLPIRRTIGPIAFFGLSMLGAFPPSVPNVSVPHSTVGPDYTEALDHLLRSIELFEKHTGPLSEHPFFGNLGRDKWSNLHRMHLANHLSYVQFDA